MNRTATQRTSVSHDFKSSKIINEYIPYGLDKLCSPFIGGGSIELALASKEMTVYAYDSFEPLIHFWKFLINNVHLLANESTAVSEHDVDHVYSIISKKHFLL